MNTIKLSLKCNKKLINPYINNYMTYTHPAMELDTLSNTIFTNNSTDTFEDIIIQPAGIFITIVCLLLLCCLIYQLKKCLYKCLYCK